MSMSGMYTRVCRTMFIFVSKLFLNSVEETVSFIYLFRTCYLFSRLIAVSEESHFGTQQKMKTTVPFSTVTSRTELKSSTLLPSDMFTSESVNPADRSSNSPWKKFLSSVKSGFTSEMTNRYRLVLESVRECCVLNEV